MLTYYVALNVKHTQEQQNFRGHRMDRRGFSRGCFDRFRCRGDNRGIGRRFLCCGLGLGLRLGYMLGLWLELTVNIRCQIGMFGFMLDMIVYVP